MPLRQIRICLYGDGSSSAETPALLSVVGRLSPTFSVLVTLLLALVGFDHLNAAGTDAWKCLVPESMGSLPRPVFAIGEAPIALYGNLVKTLTC